MKVADFGDVGLEMPESNPAVASGFYARERVGEMAVEKPLDFVKITGLSPVLYFLHFISTGMNACIGDDVTEAVHPL